MRDPGLSQRAATTDMRPGAHGVPIPDIPGRINGVVHVSGGTIYGPVIGINQAPVYTDVTVHTQAGTILNLAVAPTIERHQHKPRPPRPLRTFWDREVEQATLLSELQPQRGAWISGPAGCGITALLNRIANVPAAQAFPDGIVWIEGRVESPLLDDIVQRLFRRFYTSSIAVHISEDEAATYLGDVEACFVFDALPLNWPDLVTLTNIVGRGTVLVGAEGRAPDTLLPVPLSGLPDHAARAVFTAANPNSTAADVATLLDQVCPLLNCLPLPLMLAGQLIQSQLLTLQQLLTALEQGAGTSPLARAVGQGPSMSSHNVAPSMLPDDALTRIARVVLMVLTKEEQAVLATLVRIGGYDADLATLAAVSAQPMPTVKYALGRLNELRVVEGNAQRYTILSASLRRVLDRLLTPGAERWRAATFFAAGAAQHAGDLAWLGSERGNLMAAIKTLLAEGQAAQAGALARLLQPLLVLRGQWGGWDQIIAWAAQAAAHTNDPVLQAWALHERGTRAGLHGDLEVAKVNLTEAQHLRSELGDVVGAATSEHNLRYLGLLLPPPRPKTRSRHPSPSMLRRTALTVLVLLVLGMGWSIVPPMVRAVGELIWPDLPTPIVMDSTPTVTPTSTNTPVPPTNTPTNTHTNTPVPPTNTPTNTPTDTATPTPTNTPTNTPTDTATPTPTNTPTDTATPTPTNTPTDTATPTPTLSSEVE